MTKKIKFNQLKAGVILSYVSTGVSYVVSMVYTPIMLRLLGQSEYGLYSLVSSVVAYLGLMNFGFASAYMKYYSKYKAEDEKEKIAKLNGMFLIIFVAISAVAFAAGIIMVQNSVAIFGSKLTDAEHAKAKILMLILVINIALSFPNIIFNAHINANERFFFQKLVHLLRAVVNPFLVLPALFLGYGSVAIVVVTLVLNLSIYIANATYCFKKLNMKFDFKGFDFKLMKEMSVFSFFIFINIVVDQINWSVDKYILGRYYGTKTVAIYGVAGQINLYYISLSTAISNVFIPRVHKMVALENNNKALTDLFTRVGRVQFVFMSLISTGFIFIGRPFINMWAGPDYDASYLIALVLIIPITVELIQNIGIEIQRAKNMHKFRSVLLLCIAIANLFLTLYLAREYGALGAAIGTALALIIGNGIIMNWYYHKKVGLDIKYFWGQIVRLMAALPIPILYGIVINRIVDLYSWKMIFICGFGYVIVFAASMWYLGFNNYERELFAKPFNRVMNRLKRKS